MTAAVSSHQVTLPACSAWCNRFYSPGRDEVGQRRLGNTHMVAEVNEPDAPLSDETTRKTLARAEQLDDLGNGERPIHLLGRLAGRHAAPPVAKRTSPRSWARRLASSRECFQRIRP
jgi:hypothetical protein